MNLKLSLNPEDLKKLLPLLWKIEPYVFGAVLVAVFAFTAYEVNGALNVKPLATVAAPATAASKIVFDQSTINSLKTLQPVGGDVPTGTLGSNNPFN
ncbi:MAG TPA: hypothetical protein VMS08_04230 [Candidatus Saccharimonadia bacterium]|nr:hypothetical protein [Candidatus Saccharimonadia bacterium]